MARSGHIGALALFPSTIFVRRLSLAPAVGFPAKASLHRSATGRQVASHLQRPAVTFSTSSSKLQKAKKDWTPEEDVLLRNKGPTLGEGWMPERTLADCMNRYAALIKTQKTPPLASTRVTNESPSQTLSTTTLSENAHGVESGHKSVESVTAETVVGKAKKAKAETPAVREYREPDRTRKPWTPEESGTAEIIDGKNKEVKAKRRKTEETPAVAEKPDKILKLWTAEEEGKGLEQPQRHEHEDSAQELKTNTKLQVNLQDCTPELQTTTNPQLTLQDSTRNVQTSVKTRENPKASTPDIQPIATAQADHQDSAKVLQATTMPQSNSNPITSPITWSFEDDMRLAYEIALAKHNPGTTLEDVANALWKERFMQSTFERWLAITQHNGSKLYDLQTPETSRTLEELVHMFEKKVKIYHWEQQASIEPPTVSQPAAVENTDVSGFKTPTNQHASVHELGGGFDVRSGQLHSKNENEVPAQTHVQGTVVHAAQTETPNKRGEPFDDATSAPLSSTEINPQSQVALATSLSQLANSINPLLPTQAASEGQYDHQSIEPTTPVLDQQTEASPPPPHTPAFDEEEIYSVNDDMHERDFHDYLNAEIEPYHANDPFEQNYLDEPLLRDVIDAAGFDDHTLSEYDVYGTGEPDPFEQNYVEEPLYEEDELDSTHASDGCYRVETAITPVAEEQHTNQSQPPRETRKAKAAALMKQSESKVDQQTAGWLVTVDLLTQRLESPNVGSHSKYYYYYNRGLVYEKLAGKNEQDPLEAGKHLERSLRDYGLAITSNSDRYEAFFSRSTIQLNLGRLDEALSDAESAFQLKQGNKPVRRLLRMLQVMKEFATQHNMRQPLSSDDLKRLLDIKPVPDQENDITPQADASRLPGA